MNNIELENIIFKEVFEKSLDAFLILDLERSKFLFYNEKALELYGYTKEEFATITPYGLTFEFMNHLEMEHKQEFIVQKGWDTFITKHKTKSGKILNIYIKSKKIEFQDNFLLFITLIDLEKESIPQKYFLQKNHTDLKNYILIQKKYYWHQNYELLIKDSSMVHLTEIEKQFISLLTKNLDCCLNLEQIQTFFEKHALNQNSLLSLIKRIRKKTSKEFIKNYYGKGYIITSK